MLEGSLGHVDQSLKKVPDARLAREYLASSLIEKTFKSGDGPEIRSLDTTAILIANLRDGVPSRVIERVLRMGAAMGIPSRDK